jgi:hypothetical protein
MGRDKNRVPLQTVRALILVPSLHHSSLERQADKMDREIFRAMFVAIVIEAAEQVNRFVLRSVVDGRRNVRRTAEIIFVILDVIVEVVRRGVVEQARR